MMSDHSIQPLWKHQIDAIALACASLRRVGGFALWHEMATGKTRTAIEIAKAVGARQVLVVCPPNVIDTWMTQVRQYSASTPRRLDVVPVKRDLILSTPLADQFVVVNYETMWRTPRLLKESWDMVIFDEAHRLKLPSGKASRFAAQLAERTPCRLALSGTPTPHGPLDAWAVYRAITPRNPLGFRTFTQFRTRFLRPATYEEWGDRDLVFQRNRGGDLQRFKLQDIDLLHERMYGGLAHRVLADDVVERPEPQDHEIAVDLEPEALRVYKRLEKDLVAGLSGGETVSAANAMVAVLRLAQLTGGTLRDDDWTQHLVSEAKEKALGAFLEDAGASEPVVVFCRFHSDMDAAARACDAAGRSHVELSGRVRELDQWLADDGPQVLIAQIQAGGVGIDLTRARIAVYYSLGYSLGDYLQSRARIHRPNSRHKVVAYYHIAARGTVDEGIMRALSARQDVVSALIEMRGEGGP